MIYVREGVYERLKEALSVLPKAYSLVLYDGYRPFQVTVFVSTFCTEDCTTISAFFHTRD
ncbi:hypothetical protein C3943_19855 [Lysinibacillus sp. B2A1]|nr:hypothetical protein C3943_19855 [Lysinibacillus sp. B2A1]